MRPPFVLDTFPAFERFWRSARSESITTQIQRWEDEYMAPWPELLEKQRQSYAQEGVDWMEIARRRIFPYLPERLPRMRRFRRALLESLPGTWKKTRRELRLDLPVRVVIYVGVGCGAGWATQYGGRPACLVGLENAVEHTTGRGWARPGLIPHEVAHLAHDEWRRRDGLKGIDEREGPSWQLYVEGFATEVERRVVDPPAFRLRTGRQDWLGWCERHRSWLARKFLRDAHHQRSMRPFFGSWYDIRGQIECGYWLGAEVIRELRGSESWRRVATLSDNRVTRQVRAILTKMSELSGS